MAVEEHVARGGPQGASQAVSMPGQPPPTVLLIGNPNVGKTSLFNHLAGKNERVGNYPGVTVERRSAEVQLSSERRVCFVDVPGAYSLSARSSEEQVAMGAVIGWADNPAPDLAVVVVDAGQLARNLYLTLQVIELQVPVVVALNMVDEAGEGTPSVEQLRERLGVACVATNARTGEGMSELRRTVERALDAPCRPKIRVAYPHRVTAELDFIADALPASVRRNVERDRALSLWALCSIEPDDELVAIPDELRGRCLEAQRRLADIDLDQEIIAARYQCIEESLDLAARDAQAPNPAALFTERLDRVLLHPVLGFGIFVAIMALLFQALFAWADPAIGLIEGAVGFLQSSAAELLPKGFVRDLMVEGVIGGVGNVVVFLPQIMLLFLFVGFLEDSGYMARVAYLMDRLLRVAGLHGRAFVPMMSGFACAVPAIMATRTMERRRDQLLTMLVVPLMSCSARLPVYTLVIGTLFPPSLVFGFVPVQGLLMVSIYLLSTCAALAAAAVLGRTVVRGRSVPLILELPPYRVPGVGVVARMVARRAGAFLKEAGTTILLFTVIMWGLLSYPKPPQAAVEWQAQPAPAAQAVDQPLREPAAARPPTEIEQSYGGQLGKWLEPVLRPLGFDWKLGVGIIGAFAAREVFVSTLGLVYRVEDPEEGGQSLLREKIRAESRADGAPAYSPLVGLSLMVFFALACQCMSTLAVVRRETSSWRWPAFLFGYMTALAWVSSFAVFQVGTLLGY